MLVAIPLQGFAGVSAAVCAGHHQSLYGAGLESVAHAAHSGDHVDAHAGHHTANAIEADAGTPAHNAHQKCGGCGPCCLGAVLTSSVQPTVAVLTGKTDFASLSSRHVSPAVRGLDRPPQTVRA